MNINLIQLSWIYQSPIASARTSFDIWINIRMWLHADIDDLKGIINYQFAWQEMNAFIEPVQVVPV
jgi:hypothetical protein